MAYLHAHGVVHADLKPENILLTGAFHPRIGDFGAARGPAASDAPAAEREAGTPAYMAPELIHVDDPPHSPAVDVYAWAVIYYELLTGKLPFSERGPLMEELIYKCVKAGERGTRTPEINDAKWDLLERCWHAEPARRPGFAELVATPERIALDGYDVGVFDEYLHELRDYEAAP
jgi:serine/threonine protein kinase